MRIPFITPIACVWHFPLRVQKKADDMHGMLAAILGKREEFQRDEPRYEDVAMVHWKPVRSPDDLPPDLSIRDIKISTMRSDPIERELIVLDRTNAVLHRQGHTWATTTIDGNRRFMRGIVAGVTRRPWIAERWLATGNTAGLCVMELPVLEGVPC